MQRFRRVILGWGILDRGVLGRVSSTSDSKIMRLLLLLGGQKDCRRRVSISLPLDLQSSALPYELRQPSLKAETDFCYPFSPNQPRWLSDSCELLVREQASLPRGKLLTGKGGSMDESGAPWIS